MFWKKRPKESDRRKWLAYTKDGEVFHNVEAQSGGDNPLLADSMRFIAGYMQGQTREEIIRQSEGYFRQRPAHLAFLLHEYGRRSSGSRTANRGPESGATAAPYTVTADGGFEMDEDYMQALQGIYRKCCREGTL